MYWAGILKGSKDRNIVVAMAFGFSGSRLAIRFVIGND